MKYTEKEITFIKENYPLYGQVYCGKVLNRNADSIGNKARLMGFYKMKGSPKHDSERPVSDLQFNNLNPTLCYFLGLMFADGSCIIKTYNNNTTQYRIALEIISKDANNIENLMMSIGKWSIQKRKRKASWQETTTFVTNNKPLCERLIAWGFGSGKSKHSFPVKLLDTLSEDLKLHFIKGYLDGDGFVKKKRRGFIMQFSSERSFDWSWLKNHIERCGSKTYVYDTKNEKGKGSTLNITHRDFIPFMRQIPNIGFDRKFIELQKIIKYYEQL